MSGSEAYLDAIVILSTSRLRCIRGGKPARATRRKTRRGALQSWLRTRRSCEDCPSAPLFLSSCHQSLPDHLFVPRTAGWNKLDDLLIPPFRFALLAASVSSSSATQPTSSTQPLYRGSLPKPHNLPFLQTLSLRRIISLTPKSIKTYEEHGDLISSPTHESKGYLTEWAQRNDIELIHVKVGKAKDGAIPFSAATVKHVLEMLVNKANYPIYIHDLDGSDVLAMLGAALRKLQGWSERAWTEEMSRFLRQPPAEAEHLLFLRRLLPPSSSASSQMPSTGSNSTTSTTTTAPAITDAVVVPKTSTRVNWLWPQGFPGKKGVHHQMKVIVETDPDEEILKKSALESGKKDAERVNTKRELKDENEGRKSRNSLLQDEISWNRVLGEKDGRGSRKSSVAGETTPKKDMQSDGEQDEGDAEEYEDQQEDEGEEHEDDEDDEYDEEEELRVSKTIEALDLGL